MIDYDTEFRRLVARERVAALAADWRHAAPPGPRTPQRSPSGRRANTLALLFGQHHHRHAHRVAAHRG